MNNILWDTSSTRNNNIVRIKTIEEEAIIELEKSAFRFIYIVRVMNVASKKTLIRNPSVTVLPYSTIAESVVKFAGDGYVIYPTSKQQT